MGDLKTPIADGILIPERCQFSAAAATGATTTDSSYTEAGPGPGLAVAADQWSRLQLEVRGQQGSDIDAIVRKGGSPARDGVQLAIKKGTETEYLTWDGPGVCTDFIPLDWGNDSTEVHAIATIPSSQKVVVAALQSANTVKLRVIDTDHSVTEQSATCAAGTDWNYPALVVLPGSERILCFHGGAAYYSDDEGATWATHSDSITDQSTTNYGPTVACEYRGDIVLFVEDTATPETIHHLVSTDGGATFTLVSTVASLGVRVDCVSNSDGIHVCWVDQNTAIEYRKLGMPFEALDTVAQTAVSTGSQFDEAAIWADGAGTLYILSGDYRGFVFASHDAGETWDVSYKSRAFQLGHTADTVSKYSATYALGQAFVVTGWHDGTSYATTRPGVVVLGGWADLQIAGDALVQPYKPENRWGFAPKDSAANSQGATLFPWDVPDNQGWTAAGAGTGAVSNTNGSLNISTSSNAKSYSIDLGTTPVGMVGRATVRQVSGGSTSAQDIAITVRLADAGSYEYEAEILISAAAVYVNDVNSAATANASITMTSYVQLMWDINTNDEAISVFYRSPGSVDWTQIGSAVALTDAGVTANNGEIAFGNIASATAESDWREVHYCAASANQPGLTIATTSRYSRSFNSRPEPIPEMGTTTGAAFLSAVAGPARVGETFAIATHDSHAIENTAIELSPGPSATWRSTDTSEQKLVYDLGANGWVGHAIALVVRNANFQTIYLESYNGSTWDTEATLDLAEGFTALEYTLSGDMLSPDLANTSGADRWLWEQEKRGGWVRAAASAGPTIDATRIVAQSSGGWQTTAAGKTVIPMVQLSDPTSIAAHGGTKNCALVSSDGLAIKYLTAVQSRRYWRWRIPAGTAGEDTPDSESYYEAGTIAICRVVALGDLTTWGNSDQATPNTDTSTTRSGTDRVRERGDEKRRWQLGWAAGPNNQRQLREGTDADYIGPTTGLALAGNEDVFHLLRGVMRITGGGSLPVCAVAQLPNADATITDPSRFLVGHLSGPIRATHSGGQKMGTSEVIRVDSISITELVD